MRIGISSWSYPWAVGVPGTPPPNPLTAFDLLDRAVALGVDVVQIADNLPLHDLTAEERERLRGRADGLGLALEVGTIGFEPAHLRRYLGIARQLGSCLLRVVIDTPQTRPSHGEVVATLRDVAPDLDNEEVDLLIENHDRFPARTLADVVGQVRNDRLGICFDTVNSVGCLEAPQLVFDVLRPLVRNVHVKDFRVARVTDRMGFTVTGAPVGQGDLDVDWLVREVAAAAPGATLVLELWPPRLSTTQETIAEEQAWVEQSIAHLRDRVDAVTSDR